MYEDQYLDEIVREITPPETEERAVRAAMDRVEAVLEDLGGPLAIAERKPCGSSAKATMLKGRKEADLVLILAKAPDDHTLSTLARELRGGLAGELDGEPELHFKAVELPFRGGVHVDVLPVARVGRTVGAEQAPDKLRHALSGPIHVEWYKQHAHGRVTHPVTRLLKRWRDCNRELMSLSSFSLEVAAVNLLGEHPTLGLAPSFTAVMAALADGALSPTGTLGFLVDPADPNNNLLAKLSPSDHTLVREAARRAMRAIESESWSQVFPEGRPLVGPSVALAGRTLA